MKDFFRKNKYFILLVLVFITYFLWFQIRPYYIKKTCADFAMSKALGFGRTTWDPDEYNDQFKRCTREYGL